jgi:hypothetical protein
MPIPTPPRPRSALAAPAALLLSILPELGAVQTPVEGTAQRPALHEDPRSWLPADETLRFKVEVSLGPVRGLDVGQVVLHASLAPGPVANALEASAEPEGSRRLVGTLESRAEGGYLGYEAIHTYQVLWYAGEGTRIEQLELLRGSHTKSRQVALGEIDGRWQREYRRDHHCKGCEDPSHMIQGRPPWSRTRHCRDCERPEHHVWQEAEYQEVPSDSVDVLSAIYLARGFLRSEADELELHVANKDKLWSVRVARGERAEIETEAGTFDCTRILIGPRLAQGDPLGEESKERFEALFGLHGNISVWVEHERAFPVRIEGEAPFGPFDVAIRASLSSRQGG